MITIAFLPSPIPKFNLKIWVPPFLENLSPLFVSPSQNFFQAVPLFEFFKIYVLPPFWKGRTRHVFHVNSGNHQKQMIWAMELCIIFLWVHV